MYFAWYGFGRMFIEGLRTDSLYVGPFRISQLVGAVCFVAGMALIVAGMILAKKGKLNKWFTVRWAEPAPAEGVVETETIYEEEVPADAASVTEDTVEPEACPPETDTPDNQ